MWTLLVLRRLTAEEFVEAEVAPERHLAFVADIFLQGHTVDQDPQSPPTSAPQGSMPRYVDYGERLGIKPPWD